MSALMKSRVVTIAINCDPQTVYDFVSDLSNLPKWATTFCRAIKVIDGQWLIDTAQGPLKIRIAAKNNLGVLDHYVTTSLGNEVFVPMRVVPNASGTDIIFTIFQQANMSEEQFQEDARLVAQDLQTLKRVLKNKEIE